jgi:hypothetical protein
MVESIAEIWGSGIWGSGDLVIGRSGHRDIAGHRDIWPSGQLVIDDVPITRSPDHPIAQSTDHPTRELYNVWNLSFSHAGGVSWELGILGMGRATAVKKENG